MRRSRIILFLCAAMPCTTFALVQKNTDNFWEIHLAKEFEHPDKSEDFWRTHQSGDVVEVYEACASKPAVAKAKAKADGSWSLSADFGNLNAKVDGKGHIEIHMGDKLYATGQRIARSSCNGKIPEKIIPIVPKQGERSFAAEDGPAKILDLASQATLPSSRVPALAALPSIPTNTTTLPSGDELVCNTAPVVETAVRQLDGIPTLGPNAAIYPGALLQGKEFEHGSFAPITIARSGGTISISGINVEKVSKTVPIVSAEMVNAAIAKLNHQRSLGTESAFSFRTDVVYNSDQLAYALGLDGRFLNGLDSSIRIDPNSLKNYVLATFTQVYFTASFEDPETKYSVFEDGENLDIEEGQIAPDNPPLYVKSVGYGRTLYFLVTSTHEASAIQKALNAAQEGKGDETTLSNGVQVPYSKILQESTVSGFVQGGDASTTLDLITQSAGTGKMYEAFKKTIADAKVAQLTDASKGLAVTYSLNYLGNRAPAALGFATASNRRSCTVKPKQYAFFAFNILGVDDNAKITLIGPNGEVSPVWNSNGALPQYVPISDLIIPKNSNNYVLRLELYNVAGPSGLNFQFTRYDPNTGAVTALDNQTGTMVPQGAVPRIWPPPPPYPVVNTGGSWNVGWIVDYRIQVNRGTGAVTVIQGR